MSLQFLQRRTRKPASANSHVSVRDPAEAVRRNVDRAQRHTPLALPF